VLHGQEWAFERLGDEPTVELWGAPPEGEVSEHVGVSVKFGG
jgi:hypothetical protein